MNRLDLNDDLDRLGDALRDATTVDLAREQRSTGGAAAGRRPLWRRPKVIGAVLVAAVAVPGGAAVAGVFDSPAQVAQSMPAGTLALGGTDPTCTVVTKGVEYHCTLASAPSADGGPPAGQWKGTVEDTVGSDQHVNGGCRSLDGAGTVWECWLGQAAVTHGTIGGQFLGQHVDGPGVG